MANIAASVTVEAEFDALDEKRKNKKPTRQPKTLELEESTLSDDDYEHDVAITTVDTRDPSVFGSMSSTTPPSTTLTTIQVTKPGKNKGGKFKGDKPAKTEKPKKDKKDKKDKNKKKNKKTKEEITTTTTTTTVTTTVTTTKLMTTLASTLTTTTKTNKEVYVEIDTGAGYSPYGVVLAPEYKPETGPEVESEVEPEVELEVESESKPEVSLSVTGGVCPWMNQESGDCKIDYIQHCNLAAFERAVEGNCGAVNAVDTMVKVRVERTL